MIIPQQLTFVGLPKWLVDPIAAPKGVEHGGTATTFVYHLYKVFSIDVYVCFIVYGIQCTYMYVYEEWLMCIQSMLVEWLAAIVN